MPHWVHTSLFFSAERIRRRMGVVFAITFRRICRKVMVLSNIVGTPPVRRKTGLLNSSNPLFTTAFDKFVKSGIRRMLRSTGDGSYLFTDSIWLHSDSIMAAEMRGILAFTHRCVQTAFGNVAQSVMSGRFSEI